MQVLILAGGGGLRLWPLSREDFPKQFLYLGKSQSLLQSTVNRFLRWSHTENIAIATNAHYEPLVRQQLEKIDLENKISILVEPIRKNTAPAVALSLKYFQEKLKVDENSPILVLPSDHWIDPEAVFLHYLEQIEATINKDRLVLFGVHPDKPETGFGYIQIGEKFDAHTHRVKKFVEKPDRKRAESYLATNEYYWNTGIFAFSLKFFIREMAIHSPLIAEQMRGSWEEMSDRFASMPDISLDYALLEKSDKIAVCPLPLRWSDVGSWDSVYDAMDKDQNQNVKIGNIFDVDTKNSLIIGGNRLISTIGLEDLLIIETEDATFISKRGDSQKVKEVVFQLLKMGRSEGSKPSIEQYSWGTIHQLDKGDGYSIKKIEISPKKSWEHRSESFEKWIVVQGTVEIKWGPREILLSSFDSISVDISEELLITNHSDSLAVIYVLFGSARKHESVHHVGF